MSKSTKSVIPAKAGIQEGNGLVPRLRFPEFRDVREWERKKLRDALDPVVREVAKPDSNYLALGIRSHGKGTFQKPDQNPEKNAMDKLFLVNRDDLIVNITFAWEGAIAIAEEADHGCHVSHRFPTYAFKLQIATPEFFRYVINQNTFFYKLGLISPGGAGRNRVMNKKDFLELSVSLPGLKEQQKIADCLSSLDTLIAAQAEKIDALKTHKKGLMQQLFPQNGETVPRLRFPEFRGAGEWVTKPLGDLGDVLMCKRIFADETNDQGGVPFFKIGTLGGKPDAFISKEQFEEYKSRYNYPRKGEILITCSGTVGKCLPFDGSDAYFQDSNIIWIDNPNLEISNELLHSLLSCIDWGRLNSTTITRIYGPDLRGLILKFPESSDEQEKIADCLSSLDTLITAETEKLDALKTHKKGLMQQLFPLVDQATM